MSRAFNFFKRFAEDEDGTALMEYTILLGILVVAVIAIISTLGAWVQSQWQAICNSIMNGTCGGGTGGGGGPGGV
jgi:pilus assembly protein Flp/PilA